MYRAPRCCWIASRVSARLLVITLSLGAHGFSLAPTVHAEVDTERSAQLMIRLNPCLGWNLRPKLQAGGLVPDAANFFISQVKTAARGPNGTVEPGANTWVSVPGIPAM